MKRIKILFSIIFLFLLTVIVNPLQAAENKILVEFYSRDDCQHCQEEIIFLEKLQREREDFEIKIHDIGEAEHYEHWTQLSRENNLAKVTPLTSIGGVVISGFDSAETTGASIISLIEQVKKTGSANTEDGKALVYSGVCDDELGVCEYSVPQPYLINLPLIGVVDIKQFSLPTLSIVLGFIDGFNPCAMWVLVTFILILMRIGSRKKMWRIVGLFVVAEAVVYYLILNIWFTAWDFVGLDRIVTPIIGLLAIGAGIYFLYEWYSSDGTCKVTDAEQKQKISQKIKRLASAPFTIATALGILGLALSVSIIEFACSIGVPQAFTKIIEMNNLSWLTTQFYMLLYILFYMIDDFVVFGIALYSIEKIGLTTKYAKWSNLIGGILMIILGLILLFKRGWLMF